MGDGAGDGRSRTAQYCLPVQTEADDECEEADRPDVWPTRVGGCGAGMAGAGKRAATERVDEETAGGGAAPCAAGQGRRSGGEKGAKGCQPTESGFTGSNLEGSAL